jgi:predicted GNAT family acetyltransferase
MRRKQLAYIPEGACPSGYTPPVEVFLQRELLSNVIILKTLAAYPNVMQVHYEVSGVDAGVLALLPTSVSLFDYATYPTADFVVMLAATRPQLVQALLPYIPTGGNLVFKLTDPMIRAVIEQTFPLTRLTAYVSYTARAGQSFAPAAQVRVASHLDERCLDLFLAQGHTRSEVEQIFARTDTLLFTIEQPDLVAVCFTYQNFAHIYEIGGLYTVPQARRQGYARSLVETALYTLSRRQLIPRYVVKETNLPSIRLAKALDLQPFVTMEHWWRADN